ncbi:hypothetical protein Cgig2_000230 [Carnegiea gigantea]|uniref:Uncharacterized protein n=1 Tax=Carnegiea gigantea TaxID=171969 RepID=A0A9Q1JSY6_9CARY|nr:hypothetical protein Cgig2_000230 [Carnegiea gigantea]
MAFAIKEQPKMEEKGACRICGRGRETATAVQENGLHPLSSGPAVLAAWHLRPNYRRQCPDRGPDLAYLAQQQRMEDAGGSLHEALGPMEAPAQHLLPPIEHEDRGSPSRSPVKYADRGSLVAQQCQPDPNEGGTAAAQDGEEPNAPNTTTGPIN